MAEVVASSTQYMHDDDLRAIATYLQSLPPRAAPAPAGPVPAATAMVVLDADRFGLSQLHQLRGRVGRGAAPGVCLLVSHAAEGTPAWTRLETLARTTDGFTLAAADLELRREGDVLGAAQSGAGSSLRLLRVTRDADLIEQARGEATALVAQDPELTGWPALTAAIDERLTGASEEFIERV